ncbi:uncharacterized protein V3H82_012325 [Fundulus diaphanus]
MDRKAQKSLDGSSEKNPNVSSSAEKTEEADYVNVAEVAAKNITSIPGHQSPSFSKFFPLLASYWLILLVVIPLHIHFHLIAQFELKQLMTELDEVKKENQQLQTEKKILTEQIETMEKTWNEQNVSRAQWSIDEYCPKSNGVQ